MSNDTADLDDASMRDYLSGRRLYGDDFSREEIEAWYKDEEQGYFNLCTTEKPEYQYEYHALNEAHAFQYLPKRRFQNVLGVGSAYGKELHTIAGRTGKFTILEPSAGFHCNDVGGVPTTYVKPNASGILPFEAEQFDLITCFGVLHHIPNVSTVLAEFYRCLKQGGYALIREPIVSLGDWRRPRNGLTKRERGIPIGILRRQLHACGFAIIREQKCMFSLTSRLSYLLRSPVYNHSLAVKLDRILCGLPFWREHYHPAGILQKLQPVSVFFVLSKDGENTSMGTHHPGRGA